MAASWTRSTGRPPGPLDQPIDVPGVQALLSSPEVVLLAHRLSLATPQRRGVSTGGLGRTGVRLPRFHARTREPRGNSARTTADGDVDPDEAVIGAGEREVTHQAEQRVVGGRPEHGGVEDPQRPGREHVVDPQVPRRRTSAKSAVSNGGSSSVGGVGAALAFAASTAPRSPASPTCSPVGARAAAGPRRDAVAVERVGVLVAGDDEPGAGGQPAELAGVVVDVVRGRPGVT